MEFEFGNVRNYKGCAEPSFVQQVRSNKFRKKHGDSTVVADPMILVSSRKMSVSMVVMKNNSRSYAHKETQDVWDPGQIKCFVELRQGSRVKTIHGTEELRLWSSFCCSVLQDL
ncbi:hypothetical protein YC2023_085107 [Brassica napus]